MTKTRSATRRLNFTRKALESIPKPKAGRLTVFDQHTAGLGVVLYPSGSRTFFHLRFVRGYPQRTTIGPLEEISIEQARGKAAELNAGIAKWKLSNYRGESPFEDSGRVPTLEELVQQYLEKRIDAHAKRPEKARRNIEWMVGKYLAAWRRRRIDSIAKADVLELHARIGKASGKHSANRVVQFLRALFYWADERAGIWHGTNPAVGVQMFHEAKRTRYIEPQELPAFFAAIEKEKNADLADFVKLALWTGARRNDVLAMRWENVSLADNRWLIPNPKNRVPYTVALTPEAVGILSARAKQNSDSPWVFPSHGRTGHIVDLKCAWRKLLERAGLASRDLRQHDLRRTLGSFQAAQGTALQIIGKSLGHKSLAATQIYSQLDLDPVRASVMSATRAILAASKKKLLPEGVR